LVNAGDDLKILFIASEAVPFAKTGGLADVIGALPAALRRQGAEVRVVLPLYRTVREGPFQMRPVSGRLPIPLGRQRLSVAIRESTTEEGVKAYFIEREDLYERPNLYGNAWGDYYDNLERFALFCHAALRVPETLSFRPHILHCHDWQTGLVPALLKGPCAGLPNLGSPATVFTIHNLGFQGLFSTDVLPVTGLPGDAFLHPDGIEYWGNISLLKAGIVFSDAVTTVSPTYAREIQTPEYGRGMDGILRGRAHVLHGILNGIDARAWDPATDRHIGKNYSPADMTGKTACKANLIREMGLDADLLNRKRPLFAMISRLDAQKGFDMVSATLGQILAMDAGFVILGTGEEGIEGDLRKIAADHPGRVGLKIGLDDPLAHRIVAGADIFLIPSRYEPCGLTQMYALRYGTVPVVRATGGLADTVTEFDEGTGEGTGFRFGPYEPKALLKAVTRAVRLYERTVSWDKAVANAMAVDFSWDRSASRYLDLYRSIL
jgi:starch synthase